MIPELSLNNHLYLYIISTMSKVPNTTIHLSAYRPPPTKQSALQPSPYLADAYGTQTHSNEAGETVQSTGNPPIPHDMVPPRRQLRSYQPAINTTSEPSVLNHLGAEAAKKLELERKLELDFQDLPLPEGMPASPEFRQELHEKFRKNHDGILTVWIKHVTKVSKVYGHPNLTPKQKKYFMKLPKKLGLPHMIWLKSDENRMGWKGNQKIADFLKEAMGFGYKLVYPGIQHTHIFNRNEQ